MLAVGAITSVSADGVTPARSATKSATSGGGGSRVSRHSTAALACSSQSRSS
jgi:hypothetical protein